MKHLFVYGTLMFDEVRHRILSGHVEMVAAELRGYRRLSIRGEDYPAVVKSSLASVEGMLILDLADSAIRRLDRFEGEYYERRPVFVRISDSDVRTRCETYVLRGRYKSLLAKSDWDPEAFRVRHLQKFLCRYRGF